MSIWGKVIGGVAGFAIGGPLGAILGAAAGHAVDRAKIQTSYSSEFDSGTRQVAFTTAVIVLCAKMAKADGQVTPDEIAAFKELFEIPPDELKNVGDLFDQKEQQRKWEVEMLENEIEELKKKIASRQKNKNTIIRRRVEELLGVEEDLEWD